MKAEAKIIPAQLFSHSTIINNRVNELFCLPIAKNPDTHSEYKFTLLFLSLPHSLAFHCIQGMEKFKHLFIRNHGISI